MDGRSMERHDVWVLLKIIHHVLTVTGIVVRMTGEWNNITKMFHVAEAWQCSNSF